MTDKKKDGDGKSAAEKKATAPRTLKQKVHEIIVDTATGPLYFYAYGLTKQGAINTFVEKIVSVDIADPQRMIAHIRAEKPILGESEAPDPRQGSLMS